MTTNRIMYPEAMEMLFVDGSTYNTTHWSERANETRTVYVPHREIVVGEEVEDENTIFLVPAVNHGDYSCNADYPLTVAVRHGEYFYFRGERYRESCERDMAVLAEEMTEAQDAGLRRAKARHEEYLKAV